MSKLPRVFGGYKRQAYDGSNNLLPYNSNRVLHNYQSCRLEGAFQCCTELWYRYFLKHAKARYNQRRKLLLTLAKSAQAAGDLKAMRRYARAYRAPFESRKVKVRMEADLAILNPNRRGYVKTSFVFICSDTRSDEELQSLGEERHTLPYRVRCAPGESATLQFLPSHRVYGPSSEEGHNIHITRGALCIPGIDDASTELTIPDSAMDPYSQRMRAKENARLTQRRESHSQKNLQPGNRGLGNDKGLRLEDPLIAGGQKSDDVSSWYGSKKRRTMKTRRVRTIEVSTSVHQCVQYGSTVLDLGDTLLAYATLSKRAKDKNLADKNERSNSATGTQKLPTNVESNVPPVQPPDDDILPDISDFDDIDWEHFDENDNQINSVEIDMNTAKSLGPQSNSRSVLARSLEPQVSISYEFLPLSTGHLGQDPSFTACISLSSRPFDVALHAEVIPRSQMSD